MEKAKMSEERQKIRKKCKNIAKSGQHGPQTKKGFFPRRDTRDPLSTP